MFKYPLALFILLVAFKSITAQTTAVYSKNEYKQVFTPDLESLSAVNKQPEWFKDAKLGIYFHWGLYSVPAFKSEWYAKWMHVKTDKDWASGTYEYHSSTFGDPSVFGYHHFKDLFKAEHYNPKQWVKLFKQAGAKFTGPVVQHHDGFAMWKSSVNPNNAFIEGPKKDLAGMFLQEAKKQNLKTIATFHHALTMPIPNKDSNVLEGYYPYNKAYFTSTNDEKLKWMYGNVPKNLYLPYWENLVYEVVDLYQPDMIWFDSGSRRIPTQHLLNVFAHHFNAAAAREAEVVVFTKEKDRLEHIRVLDQEQGGLKDMPKDYWMTDITLSEKGWCYIQNQTYKPKSLLIRNMIDVWSKRGIVLLNVSPTASGKINKPQQSILKALGKWMDIYGEAIYDTRSHTVYGYGDAVHQTGSHAEQSATIQYSANDIRFTTSKDQNYIYVFLLGQPKSGETLSIHHVLHNMPNKNIVSVSQLGSTRPVLWEYNNTLKIKAPKPTRANAIATVFKVELTNVTTAIAN